MRLHPSVGLDDLLGKRGGRQNLRHQRIRIQRNRRYQPLQLLGSLLRVGGRLRGLRARRGAGLVRLAPTGLAAKSRTIGQRQQENQTLLAQSKYFVPCAYPRNFHVLEPPLHVFYTRGPHILT